MEPHGPLPVSQYAATGTYSVSVRSILVWHLLLDSIPLRMLKYVKMYNIRVRRNKLQSCE
jgi:hypothetical protein